MCCVCCRVSPDGRRAVVGDLRPVAGKLDGRIYHFDTIFILNGGRSFLVVFLAPF